jgi:hypothetical protein
MSDDIDLETGENSQSPKSNAGPQSNRDPNSTANPTGQRTAAERLKLFRDLVGIHPLPMKESGYKRPAPNVGTYKRLVETLAKRRVEYYVTASFINSCLFGQIIVAAALTALGASSGSHVLITILGSINTIIAGVMTYLKGQGLPDRLLEDANGLRRVREYLEQVERQLISEDSKLDVEREAKIIYDMYNEVRKNAEDNIPSNWKSLDTSKAKADAIKLEKGKESQTKYQSIGETGGPVADKTGPDAQENPSSSAPV